VDKVIQLSNYIANGKSTAERFDEPLKANDKAASVEQSIPPLSQAPLSAAIRSSARSYGQGLALPRGREMADLTREEVDAKIAASEARSETKMAKLEGKIDLVLEKLDNLTKEGHVARTNQWVIGFGLAALIVGVAALLPVFFGIGDRMHDIVERAVASHFQSGAKPGGL
jgi:hypothetical protein